MSGLIPQSDPKRISLGPGFDNPRTSGNQARRRHGPRGGWGFDGRRGGSAIAGSVEILRLDFCAHASEERPGGGAADEARVDRLEEVGAAARRDRLGVPPRESRSIPAFSEARRGPHRSETQRPAVAVV